MAKAKDNNRAFDVAELDDINIVKKIMEAKSIGAEISDENLYSNDTKNMIEHGKLYTRLLDIYVKNAEITLETKRRHKEEFYQLCEHILCVTCIMFFSVIFFMLTGTIKSNDISVLLGTVISFLTVFVVVPKTIAKYLFNAEEEKYMTDIIQSVQNHDAQIRKKRK